mgnify:CR=1 FL=1
MNVCSAQAIYRASEWLALFELKVSKVTLSAPITIIELHVDDIEKNQGEVADLYQGQQGRLSHQQLASLLLNKLGEASVFHIKQGNSHEPEHASVYLPVDYSQRQSQKKREVLPSSSAIRFTERPSFLLSEPEKVYAPISVYHGPERIQTAWWRENAVNRDYFIGRNESGQWCWVYRQADNQWFIHGYFA